jgi:hypothetical protein
MESEEWIANHTPDVFLGEPRLSHAQNISWKHYQDTLDYRSRIQTDSNEKVYYQNDCIQVVIDNMESCINSKTIQIHQCIEDMIIQYMHHDNVMVPFEYDLKLLQFGTGNAKILDIGDEKRIWKEMSI